MSVAPSAAARSRRSWRVPTTITVVAPSARTVCGGHDADGSRADHDDRVTRDQTACAVESVHRRARGRDQNRLLPAEVVGERVDAADVVHDVLGESAVTRESRCPVPFIGLAVVLARGVGAVEAVSASAAPVMDVDRDPLADRNLVDTLAACHHSAGPLVARCERTVGRLAGKGVGLDRHIGSAGPAHRDPDQHLVVLRTRHRLVDDPQVIRAEEHGRTHDVGNVHQGTLLLYKV